MDDTHIFHYYQYVLKKNMVISRSRMHQFWLFQNKYRYVLSEKYGNLENHSILKKEYLSEVSLSI